MTNYTLRLQDKGGSSVRRDDGGDVLLVRVRAVQPDGRQQGRPGLALDGRPAWFRVYNCFGKIFACFWHPETHATTLVTPAEIDAYRLHDLERISRTIALISGYTWFSTEIALTARAGRRAFLPIDYLNNKCFMLTHSEFGPSGIPEEVAQAVAREIVEQTWWHARRFNHLTRPAAYRYAA